jgi:glucosamine-6-phosphate deaminase
MEQAISYERIPTSIFDDSEKASKAVAVEIANLIRLKNKEDKPTVLGLATGSSPKKVYQELIRMPITIVTQIYILESINIHP